MYTGAKAPFFIMPHIHAIINELKKHFPDPRSDLHYSSPWQLFVAVVLSAQCTDKRVNEVSRILFDRYPDVQSFSRLSTSELEGFIQSTGFFRNKARHITDAAHMIIEKWGGKVPLTMEELLTLPGIGRKSANVLMTVYAEPQGIVVDTHVIRISGRLSLSQSKAPQVIEKDLTAVFPHSEWAFVNQAMVLFGRYICKARNPECGRCDLHAYCILHNGKLS